MLIRGERVGKLGASSIWSSGKQELSLSVLRYLCWTGKTCNFVLLLHLRAQFGLGPQMTSVTLRSRLLQKWARLAEIKVGRKKAPVVSA